MKDSEFEGTNGDRDQDRIAEAAYDLQVLWANGANITIGQLAEDKDLYSDVENLTSALPEFLCQEKSRLSGHDVLMFIDRGRFGQVYLCRDAESDGFFVLKFVREIPATASDQARVDICGVSEWLLMFANSSAAEQELFIKIIDAPQETEDDLGKCWYYSLECADNVHSVDGSPIWSDGHWLYEPRTLEFELQNGCLSEYEMLILVERLASGVHFLHHAGRRHFDLKPPIFCVCGANGRSQTLDLLKLSGASMISAARLATVVH